ncbi:DEKNAAC103972 [Brettanomyces naardenensis]|uniref:DEKNAAC103972 n=1 Tax=Brettanomyces naardenensis TaxID=13370 RepID=A0A448YPV3_BRENA|nr:DEKNAAC103972 [Brettanomyces naardenensis]
MAFHRVNIGNGIESWSVIGIAATGVISLNMSDIRQRIPTLPSKNGRSASSTGSTPSTSSTLIRTKRAKVLKEPIDWLDEQDRKRLVWGIAMLDVFSSFSSGTPLRIPISEIEFSSPFSTSIWMDGKRGSVLPQASLTADAFTYYTQIIKVFRGVHSFLAQPRDISDKSAVGEWFVSFHQIETEIREWKDALPKKYRLLLDSNVLDVSESGTELPVLVLLHSAYNLALIKMHSSYGYPHVESYVFRHSEQSKRICLSSVANITALVNQIVKERSELIEYLGFHYGFCIWVCSRLLIVNSIFEQKDGNMVDKNDMNEKLTLFSNILKRIGKNSPACQKHHKILKQLINLNMSVSNMIESEDDEQIAPSQAIADMRIHTDLLTLILTNKLSELEPGSVNPSATDLQGLAMRYNLNDVSQENMLLEGFQFDAKSDGFEDLFGYLDSNTKY